MQTSSSGKLSYSPINDAHAIVEVIIFIQFTPEFSKSTIKKLTVALEQDLKSDLPRANPIRKIAFQFNPEEQQPSSLNLDESVGIELQSINEDGNLEWMLRATENTIAVHCLNYTRWEDVWQKAEAFLRKAFTHIEGSDSFVSHIGLKYVDRFLYNGDPEHPNLSELFSNDNPYLNKTSFDHQLWHCNSGWFETLGNLKCLNQLNIAADFINIQNKKTLSVTIDHNAITFMDTDSNLHSILEENGNQEPKLKEIACELHSKNKQLLTALLSVEMQKRINLT